MFIPLTLWYAGRFSDLPELSFAKAGLEDDHTKRVMVSGEPVAIGNSSEEGLSFFMTDEEGTKERVVYEGEEPITADKISAAERVEVVGHMCSDGEGPCFKAKQIFLKD